MLKKIFFMAFASALFFACGNSGNNAEFAGIIIETNTGNKPVAKVFVPTSILGIAEGDTLKLYNAESDTAGDTVYVSKYNYQHVVDVADIASGIVTLDSVAIGEYDSLTILTTSGDIKKIAVSWVIEEGNVYRYSSNGLKTTVTQAISITIPKDIASSKDVFKNMPFAIRLPKTKGACLIDDEDNVIGLEQSSSDTTLYWGIMPFVYFNDGKINFKMLDSCQTENATLSSIKFVEHFDNQKENDSRIFGNARWTTSTDSTYILKDSEPFDSEGKMMTASIWINMDSTLQADSYTRIIQAGVDSTAFILQQRANRGAVNLRINAVKNGKGDYNKVVGTAQILDGTWHNYAFTIRGDSVYTYADGELLQSTEFDSGEGFKGIKHAIVGGCANIVGGVDEIFFLDGTQTENWMKLFYALQKQAME